MDIFNIALRFLLAAAAGFAVMSFFGIRALVAVCSSVPLARRRQKEFPAFDLVLSFRRILRQTVLGVLGVSVITVLVIWRTSAPNTIGYLLGMIASFLRNLDRMTPNSRRNQRRFERTFADCYEPEDDEDTVDLLDLWK